MPRSPYLAGDVTTVLNALDTSMSGRHDVPSLTVLVGLPGSGKSTFARRLAPRIDAVILQSDALRRSLFTTPAHGEDESKRLFRAIQAAALRLLLDGLRVIIDATNLRESHRKPFYEIAARAGARLQVVHLTAPEHVALDRLAQRRDVNDPGEASQAFEAVYALLEQQEEAPRVPHLRVDTSDPVAVDAALLKLEDQRHIRLTPPVAPLAGSGGVPA